MITDMNNASTEFFKAEAKDSVSLLDCYNLTPERDNRLAVLRKVQFRTTKDGKPFIRGMFEDINGCLIVGRMFDYADINTIGRALTDMVGHLVFVKYTVDYFNGSPCLMLHSVEKVGEELAQRYTSRFTGKFALAETQYRACKVLLSGLTMSEGLTEFYRTYCDLTPLCTLSDESICKGLKGGVLDVLYNVLLHSQSVEPETVVAFIFTVLTWFRMRNEADVHVDDSIMLFIASMTDTRVATTSAGLGLLSSRIAEFTSLFAGFSKVISGDSYLFYNLYTAFAEASCIKVIEAQLPPNGFCGYKSYTVKRG